MKNMEKYGLSSWDNVVIKVGSNILAWNGVDRANENFWVNIQNMQNIVNSVDYLMRIWLNVFLVSSWAVAVWKREFEKQWIVFWDILSQDEKAFLSWNGQILLMKKYHDLFLEKKILVTQNLLTHNNFKKYHILDNLQNVWKQNIKYKTLAIINENDTISREELKFSDNDELAWYVAKEVKAKVLILLSDIDWIYKNYWTRKQELINEVDNIVKVKKYCVDSNWVTHWTWWMISKLNVMEKMLNNDIVWILTNWGEIDIIEKIFSWEDVWKTIFTNKLCNTL